MTGAAASAPLEDIQGLVLREYFMPALSLVVLKVLDAERARSWLAGLEVTAAGPWPPATDHFLNVGLTADGLRALELPAATIESFPAEFLAGPVASAERMGDVGESAPEHWVGGLGTTDAHVVLAIYGTATDAIGGIVDTVVVPAIGDGAVELLYRRDGGSIDGTNVTHFGYREGFAQPTIEGAPPPTMPDPQADAPLGAFVLGYPSQFKGHAYPVPQPPELGSNGSFAVVRVTEQDVAAFEAFLAAAATQTGLDVDTVAAMLMGRWRNGIAVAMSTDTDSPDEPIAADRMNDFDYVEDPWGERCPVGAHIRRVNPRGAKIAGGGGHLHRIIRRGRPYGPAYDPAAGDDGEERGSLSLFLNASIKDQFEFVMSEWVNNGRFAPGLKDRRCPISGVNDPAASSFSFTAQGKEHTVAGFGRFVRTRGVAYCFVPSLTALRSLGAMA